MTTIKEAVLSTVEQLLEAQNAKGMKNYGQSLDDCPVDDYNWQSMINEELIDALQYQQKEIERLKKQGELDQIYIAKLSKIADGYREGLFG